MKRAKNRKLKGSSKSYEIDQSPLYKLHSRNKLIKLLFIEPDELTNCLTLPSKYSIFTVSGREIQTPTGALRKIHWQIANFLTRLKLPHYVHSGKKKHSHITNAREHLGNQHLLTVDLTKFYPSTKRDKVFNFFLSTMKCSVYIADILSQLCTCNGHIPTGSQLSMPLVFWSNYRMFDLLSELSKKHQVKMTVYVDDITFSGDQVNKLFLSTVKKIVSSNGQAINDKKTRLYKKYDTKRVTGVVISGSETLIMNKHHKAIYQDVLAIEACKQSDDNSIAYERIKNRLLGRIHSLKLIDAKLKHRIRYFNQL